VQGSGDAVAHEVVDGVELLIGFDADAGHGDAYCGNVVEPHQLRKTDSVRGRLQPPHLTVQLSSMVGSSQVASHLR
jgi:hypothetical protein